MCTDGFTHELYPAGRTRRRRPWRTGLVTPQPWAHDAMLLTVTCARPQCRLS